MSHRFDSASVDVRELVLRSGTLFPFTSNQPCFAQSPGCPQPSSHEQIYCQSVLSVSVAMHNGAPQLLSSTGCGVQAVLDIDPRGEYKLTPHGVHSVPALSSEKVFGGHARHGVSTSPSWSCHPTVQSVEIIGSAMRSAWITMAPGICFRIEGLDVANSRNSRWTR